MPRPPPAPATGRKPQAGVPARAAGRRGAVVGGRLAYILHLHGQRSSVQGHESQLADLVAQERRLWQRVLRRSEGGFFCKIVRILCRLFHRENRLFYPSPLTAAVRLAPDKDTALNLNAASLSRLDPSGRATFDPASPAVAVSVEFLGGKADLLSSGFIATAQAGDILFGWINLNRGAALANHPAVVRVDALRAGLPCLGAAASPAGEAGGAPAASPLTGAGVRIAVIDLGFDFLHPALLRPAAQTERVRTLWLHDFVLPPDPAAPAGSAGRRFDDVALGHALAWYNSGGSGTVPDAINDHLGRLRTARGTAIHRTQIQQHGTAVAGIAAGNGRSSGPPTGVVPVPGVAPKADLILIAIGGHDEQRFANDLDVHNAFVSAFEDDSAACVALMANSDNLGPHDGTLAGERALDDFLLQSGRAIVLSAGNLNHGDPLAPGERAWHGVAVPESNGRQIVTFAFENGALWPDSAEVWFKVPAGETIEARIGIARTGLPTRTVIVTPAQGTPPAPTVVLAVTDNPATRTRVDALLLFDGDADAWGLQLFFRPAPGKRIVRTTWSVEVPSSEPVHGWLDRNNDGVGRFTGASAMAGANAITLGSPAVASRPLTVGSVDDATGNPSRFSGRGPVRAPGNGPLKPDLVAVGANVAGPRGVPVDRGRPPRRPSGPYRIFDPPGTSYAAPYIAGACALLFERFGPSATWSDIRQGILQATRRNPATMGNPEVGNWDRACGHGMLDLAALVAPPPPDTADVYLQKTNEDVGTEPFVASVFWQSPAISLVDARGSILEPARVAAGDAEPAGLRIWLRNRGALSAGGPIVTVWWAPFGAMHPLPGSGKGHGAWESSGFGIAGTPGNAQAIPDLGPDEIRTLAFDWIPPREPSGGFKPYVLMAAVSCEGDPFDPQDTLCAQNNAAALSVAASSRGRKIPFQIIGSDDTDSIVIWSESRSGTLRIEDFPVTALPWRESRLFATDRPGARPLYDGAGINSADPAVAMARRLEANDIASITDIEGADRLFAGNGSVTVEGHGSLKLPRLRIAEGVPLVFSLSFDGDVGAAVHLLHLSGGRRVGGGSVHVLP